MPTPKRNAPTITDTPTGDIEPRTGWPKTVPFASSGKNTMVVAASISICARKPAPLRSDTNTRHADVNPNAA